MADSFLKLERRANLALSKLEQLKCALQVGETLKALTEYGKQMLLTPTNLALLLIQPGRGPGLQNPEKIFTSSSKPQHQGTLFLWPKTYMPSFLGKIWHVTITLANIWAMHPNLSGILSLQNFWQTMVPLGYKQLVLRSGNHHTCLKMTGEKFCSFTHSYYVPPYQ